MLAENGNGTMTKNHNIILTLLCVAFALAGCSTTSSNAGYSSKATEQEYAKLLKVDSSQLANKLYINRVKSRKSNGSLAINLSLTSRYTKTQQLQYQFQWFDQAGGLLVTDNNHWQSFEVSPMHAITIAGLAPVTQAETFKLYVREAPKKAFTF